MGIPGQTTGEVLERLDRECTGRMPKGTNTIIMLAAGINDTQIINGEVRTDEETLRSNVKGLICSLNRESYRRLCPLIIHVLVLLTQFHFPSLR